MRSCSQSPANKPASRPLARRIAKPQIIRRLLDQPKDKKAIKLLPDKPENTYIARRVSKPQIIQLHSHHAPNNPEIEGMYIAQLKDDKSIQLLTKVHRLIYCVSCGRDI